MRGPGGAGAQVGAGCAMSTAAGDDDLEGGERGGSVREQDRFLPIANISRIMKKALPPNAKIAKDAKETVQECVSEFISFITSECAPPLPQAVHGGWQQAGKRNRNPVCGLHEGSPSGMSTHSCTWAL